MGPNAEKLHKPLHNRQDINQDRKQTEYINASYYEGETDEITCVDCLRYWSLKFVVNGMFTTSRIVGYSQFMVFMILRVIITGSLCGRLYGKYPDIQCTFSSKYDDVTTTGNLSQNRDKELEVFNKSSINVSSPEVAIDCLYVAYSGVSPITLWALGLLTVVLPWLILLPWTPLSDDQDYVVCRPINMQWPCLTIYVVRFLKACIRLLLELTCLIIIPVLYGSGIPNILTCYDDKVICELPEYKEMTYFLWLCLAVNIISCGLTICELIDICRNKQVYESEMGGYSSVSKISSARSSTGTMNGQYTYRRQPSNLERGRSTKRGMQSAVTPASGSKRRFGLTRSADPGTMSKNSKFRGRQPRPSECDEVIKMAAPTKDSQSRGARSFPKLYYPTEERTSPSNLAVRSPTSASTTQPNNVILHSTSDIEIHACDKSAAV
uniref:uncharacterized protein LOC120342721 isoform X1 n=1 Tax=Styela clava TaxID=7725 RepID=UPI00193A1C97|nr:uncharacterized protein LOC120342721 isoform X1 [Styela clava]